MIDTAFLTLDEILGIHADQIRRYGGGAGVRALERLRSALAIPETTHDGEYLHPPVFEMAGAYLFHIARNQKASPRRSGTGCACRMPYSASIAG